MKRHHGIPVKKSQQPSGQEPGNLLHFYLVILQRLNPEGKDRLSGQLHLG